MSDAELSLSARGLSSGYGSSQVLFSLDLKVPRSGAMGILGRNGVGKSTLLKTLAGEIRPRAGRIEFGTTDVTDLSIEKRAALGLGYVPQEQSVFAGLTVRENLTLGVMMSKTAGDIDLALDIFPKLGQRLGQQAGTLSGGERKMLAIGRAILGRPRLLMLDEPTGGVWIGVIDEIGERLKKLARDTAILLVEQNLDLVSRVTESVCVMGRGEIVLSGPTRDVMEDPVLFQHLAP